MPDMSEEESWRLVDATPEHVQTAWVAIVALGLYAKQKDKGLVAQSLGSVLQWATA